MLGDQAAVTRRQIEVVQIRESTMPGHGGDQNHKCLIFLMI